MPRYAIAIICWFGTTAAVGSYLTFSFLGGNRRIFLPGATTNGHYQIEEKCEACHTPMTDVSNQACLRCHLSELEEADDSHAPAKFLDPRNADRVKRIDARRCTTCHAEHRPRETQAMGVTMPPDYCVLCHRDIATARPSHVGFRFRGCQAGGCHNFHDNRSLSEKYLRSHLDEPSTFAPGGAASPAPELTAVRDARAGQDNGVAPRPDAPAHLVVARRLLADWQTSTHGQKGVSCRDCHGGKSWVDRPSQHICEGCHERESGGFRLGRHGMRLAVGLPPMSPRWARRPMKEESRSRQLSCMSCHDAHRFDTARAATEACLQCHDDRHSTAFPASRHAQVGLGCATCHMPRKQVMQDPRRKAFVEHNQNDTLRPNEKMIAPVCQRCHGLAFSIDALADMDLIERNFSGRPRFHVESIDMVRRRQKGIEP